MPEISIKDQIKKLVELQKIDSEIHEYKVQLKEKPALVEELKNQFESTKQHLNELEEKQKHIEVERKAKEVDLQKKDDDVSKANADLSALKTNKEYKAKLSEIESIKADKSIIEEEILKSYDDSDEVKDNITKEQEKVAEEEKKFLDKKKEVEDDVKVLEDRVKVLESQKNQVSSDVDSSFKTKYERIVENKEDGLAIVPVIGSSCGGCHMNVMPQQINALKMNSELVVCEICARILYIEDDL